MTTSERKPSRVTHLRSNRKGAENKRSTPCTVDNIDVAALADLYNSPPTSHIAREDLLEEARCMLARYELSPEDLEPAAHTLAKAMHMLVEQRGGKNLEPRPKAELIQHVLAWHGLGDIIKDPDANGKDILKEIFIRRPETPFSPLSD